ncbi:MAG TPA: MFS transporter, partial [Candidatus Hydrogenedentes bacterium]|nr:MFS transporter [Candidatus Hydrogenedentota bacterium]
MAELPLSKRIFYGMGGLTMALPDFIVMQWLIVRYIPPDGSGNLVPRALVGAMLLAGRFIEGMLNPVIANWSDHSRSRWGRRLPFIRLALLPLALAFYLLFNPPMDHMHWVNTVYAFVLVMTYAFLYGCVITPYLALIPEITSDLKERVDLTTFQSLFVMIGTFVFAAMPIILERFGWRAFSGTAALLLLVFFLPVATVIREKPRLATATQPKLHLFHSIKLALQNRPFRYVAGCTALYWFGLNGVIALIPHWTVCVLGRSEGNVTMLMVPFLLMNVVFFFVFNVLAARFGKYALMLVTFGVGAVIVAAFASVGVFPLGSTYLQTAVVMALFGAPAAGFMVLPFAVLADVVDYDETLTGRRREAIFFGVQGIV